MRSRIGPPVKGVSPWNRTSCSVSVWAEVARRGRCCGPGSWAQRVIAPSRLSIGQGATAEVVSVRWRPAWRTCSGFRRSGIAGVEATATVRDR